MRRVWENWKWMCYFNNWMCKGVIIKLSILDVLKEVPPQHQFWVEKRRSSPRGEVVVERKEAVMVKRKEVVVEGNFAFFWVKGRVE